MPQVAEASKRGVGSRTTGKSPIHRASIRHHVRVAVAGTVQRWDDEEGWGVLVSPDVEGTVFAHFSHIRDMTGYRFLSRGQSVEFEYETPGQDGCDHSASWVRAV